MRIAYIHAGKVGPTEEEQRAAVEAEGAERVYVEPPTRARQPRYWLPEMIRLLRTGDTLILPSLAMLGANDAEAGKAWS